MNTFLILSVLILLALGPCVLWGIFIFSGRRDARWVLILSFLLGCLTVLPLYTMDNFSNMYPSLALWFSPQVQWNALAVFFQNKAVLGTLYVTGFLAFREEFVKIIVLLFMDKALHAVHRVSDAVKIALLSGLGFAFVENVFYFYTLYTQDSLGVLFGAMIFRSLFTMSAHMIFSGILGYFYGMTRFSKALISFEYWTKQSSVFWQDALDKFQGITSWFKTNTLLFIGLFWALALHFIFNVLLHYNQIFLVMGEIILGFAFLLYLLAKKSGGLQYAESASVLESATPDQKVIFELLGTWMIEGKYKDVMDVCQRYLAKDAHNNLIQLFLARAMDEQRIIDIQDAFGILFESKTKIKKDTSLRGMVQRKIMMELLQGTLTAKPSELLSQAKVKDKEKLVAWMLKLNGQTWAMDSKILDSSVHNFEPVDSTKTLHVSTDIV